MAASSGSSHALAAASSASADSTSSSMPVSPEPTITRARATWFGRRSAAAGGARLWACCRCDRGWPPCGAARCVWLPPGSESCHRKRRRWHSLRGTTATLYHSASDEPSCCRADVLGHIRCPDANMFGDVLGSPFARLPEHPRWVRRRRDPRRSIGPLSAKHTASSDEGVRRVHPMRNSDRLRGPLHAFGAFSRRSGLLVARRAWCLSGDTDWTSFTHVPDPARFDRDQISPTSQG